MTENNLLPLIHIYESLASTQDEAYLLAHRGILPVWGSILAQTQTDGRGQMRRSWQSLTGNLFVSLRLPYVPPFNTQAGAISIAALIGMALNKNQFPVFLKWPNDLGYLKNKHFCKAGGILVEEKNRIILAGIGINLVSAPPDCELRNSSRIGACYLLQNYAPAVSPLDFWKMLLATMLDIYGDEKGFNTSWIDFANNLLVWKNQEAVIRDQGKTKKGYVKRILENGSLEMQNSQGYFEISSGSLEPERNSNEKESYSSSLQSPGT